MTLEDPCLQARGNVTRKPSLTCLEPPHFACYHHQCSSASRDSKQDFLPHMAPFWHLIFDYVPIDSEQSSFHKSVHDTSWCFRLSEQLGTSHSGTLTAIHQWMCHWETSLLAWHSLVSQDVHARLLILVNNHWPRLLDELLLQPQWEYKGTNKYDFKPICPLGSILVSHRYVVIK